MATSSSRKPRVRPYSKDYLTKPRNGHYTIQFRVPRHLQGVPPFGDKEVYKRSTGTSDRREAIRVRDAFFEEIDFFQKERAQEREDARRSPSEHYFEALNSVHGTYDELAQLRETMTEYAWDDTLPPKERARYAAQLDGIDRKLEEMRSSPYAMADRPHLHDVLLTEMVKAQLQEMSLRGLPKKTQGKLSTASKRYLEFAGHDPTLSEINRPRVVHFIRWLRSRGRAKKTADNDLTYLGQAFAYAQDTGFVPSNHANPFRGHTLTGFPAPTRREHYDDRQLRQLLEGANRQPDLMAMIYLGHYTGMRLNEAYSCTLVELEGGLYWNVATEGGKTKAATRKIPVHDELCLSLVELNLWPEPGKTIAWRSSSGNALGKKFSKLKARLFEASPQLNFHSFRHGFVTQLGAAGYHDQEYAYLVGHSTSGASTEGARTYLHLASIPKHREMIASLKALPRPSQL